MIATAIHFQFISIIRDLSAGIEDSIISKYTLDFIMETLPIVSTKNITG